MAAVIEARVQETGGSPHEETLADRKARLQRQVAAANKRRMFLSSEGAVKPACSEAEKLLYAIEQAIPNLTSNEIPMTPNRVREGIDIASHLVTLQVRWHLAYRNVLDGSGLSLRLLQIIPKRNPFETQFRELPLVEFDFDVSESGNLGWSATKTDKKFLTTDQVANLAMQMILDIAASNRLDQLK